jgi:cellulose synthase/poly-beta-1,6-N-acetylglucosamine synthase-like glycosyltransferase
MGESNMDSTPIFNGPVMAFRKDLIEKLRSETIADDTEISLKIRKKGWRAIYAPDAVAYEYTPVAFYSRLKQKVRRGQGIIQSFVRHKDFLFNSKYARYGLVIFPCEFFMHIVSPILSLMTLILILVTFLVNPVLVFHLVLIASSLLVLSSLVLFVRKLVTKSEGAIMNPFSFLRTFLNHQFCLLISLSFFILRKSNYKWETIDDVRNQCTIVKEHIGESTS